MKRRVAILFLLGAAVFSGFAQNERFAITTLNCYAFFGGGETKPPGDAAASVAALAPPTGALHDSFLVTGGEFRTHANGNAYDRIFFSEPMLNGAAGLKFEKVFVQPHTHGKGAEKYEFTDHFPVTAIFTPIAKK